MAKQVVWTKTARNSGKTYPNIGLFEMAKNNIAKNSCVYQK